MKALGISGSGRVDGNTAALVSAVLKGLAKRGAQTALLQLGAMQVAGCNSCRACKRDHVCVIQDDMYRFYDMAPQTDVIVLGSPIYLDHVTAQMKAFIDRLYCYLGPNLENCYPNKNARAVIGITYGASGEHTYDYVTEWMRERLKGYFDLETVGALTLHSAGPKPIVGGDHPVIRKAYELGRSLT